MSTRSNIAIEDPKTKKVKVIYVHSDGYPYGIGSILMDHYNKREVAELLFNHGDASYLGDTLDECSFYGRDWDRKEDPAKTHRDEWMYMHSMRGDGHIEYIYIFKDNRWHVSTGEYVEGKDLKNPYDSCGCWYYSKFEPLALNKEYMKHNGKHEKHAEVKMISGLTKMLTKNFGEDKISVQSFTQGMPKKTN